MSRNLGEFEQLLMFSVLDLGEAAYGVKIRRRIEERTGREVSPGAVYTVMDRLEKKGLVSSYLDESTHERGGRRRKFYMLEPAGAESLRNSYETLTRMAEGLLPKLAEVTDGAKGS